jgi:hypothetical protein
MAECGGSPERGLACATAFGANGDHRKKACSGKDSALVLSNGGRELQGAISTGFSPNGCGTASASSLGSRRGPKHH